jgi:hypothetical protein
VFGASVRDKYVGFVFPLVTTGQPALGLNINNGVPVFFFFFFSVFGFNSTTFVPFLCFGSVFFNYFSKGCAYELMISNCERAGCLGLIRFYASDDDLYSSPVPPQFWWNCKVVTVNDKKGIVICCL